MSLLLKLDRVSKSFAGVHALKGVSFELRAGEVHALVGENGAGKSTLIKVISGAHQPDSGMLSIAGQEIVENNPVMSRALGVAVIYQRPALLPDLTVAENIGLGLEPRGAARIVGWAGRRKRAKELLGRVGAHIDPDATVDTLTMPEQQLVEIARALGADARILILDEPTASLSDREVERLLDLVRELRRQGVGIIYISHRLEELFQVADRVTVLRDGTSVGTRAMSAVDNQELIRMMVGRDITTVYPKQTVPIGEAVLRLQNVGCRQTGVEGVSFDVRAGEIVGLAGLVGAGRTESARILFGLTPADRGSIEWRGRPTVIRSPAQAKRLGIAYVPEDRRRHGVILEMPVTTNATLAVLDRVSSRGWINFRREQILAADYVKRLSIKTASLATPVGDLSGGNQQKVSVARWLATEPKLLILDEPTQGIDVGAKAEIYRLMGELAGRGMAILMISSELPEVLGMSDRIVVMHGGTVSGMLDRAEATQERVLALALGHAVTSGLCMMRYKRELSVALAYLALLGVLAVFAPRFYQGDKFLNILVASAPVLVAAIGMTLVIISRNIDISIGSQLSICGVVAGLLAKAGMPIPLVAVSAMVVGASMGALNGLFVAVLGLPSIVVTLATMVMLREGLRWWREGESVKNLPADWQWFGFGQSGGQWAIIGIALGVFALFAWGLRYLSAGRAVYATGSDPDAAFLVGIRPKRVVFAVLTLMGALTGLAALLNAVRFPQVDPLAGTGMELQVIAAVVVGGVAISGGRGTLLGVLCGVALLGTIGSALVFLGAEAYWEKALQGAIILIAVASDAFEFKRRSHGPRALAHE